VERLGLRPTPSPSPSAPFSLGKELSIEVLVSNLFKTCRIEIFQVFAGFAKKFSVQNQIKIQKKFYAMNAKFKKLEFV
jgi:hypothetical protein